MITPQQHIPGPFPRRPISLGNQTAIIQSTPPPRPQEEFWALIKRMFQEQQCQATLNSLQNQLAVQTQANIGLQQTVATQNQNIEALKAQALSLENSINSLNSTIASLQAQLAVVPSLQTQIAALEKQVSELRATLNLIIAMI